MSLSISYERPQARRAAYGLVALEGGFALTYVVIHILFPERSWGPLRPFFDLDGEKSIPTWFSTIQLFAVGALLFLAAANNRQDFYLASAGLYIAGSVFIFLSADEAVQIHENLTYMSRRVGLNEVSFIGQWGAWIVVYAVLGLMGLVLGARHLRALWRHFRPIAVAGLVGASIFFLGAVGFEIASFSFRDTEETRTIALSAVAVEEFLEMLGVTIILYATLDLANRLSRVRVPA